MVLFMEILSVSILAALLLIVILLLLIQRKGPGADLSGIKEALIRFDGDEINVAKPQ